MTLGLRQLIRGILQKTLLLEVSPEGLKLHQQGGLAWHRSPFGWTALGSVRWAIRSVVSARPGQSLYWLYRDGSRCCAGASYESALSFCSAALAKRYAEAQEKKFPHSMKKKGAKPVMKDIKESLSRSQVNTLIRTYSTLNKVDPTSSTYDKLIKLLDSLDQKTLKQLVNANIKFVSMLARNRLKR